MSQFPHFLKSGDASACVRKVKWNNPTELYVVPDTVGMQWQWVFFVIISIFILNAVIC